MFFLLWVSVKLNYSGFCDVPLRFPLQGSTGSSSSWLLTVEWGIMLGETEMLHPKLSTLPVGSLQSNGQLM